jgi:TRAP-type mannitol/chloroaromatic compound transport system permease small subunit
MSVQGFLHTIDGISTWVGKAAAWLIMALMTVVCVEVFKRYIMNAPTAWIFDLDNMLYGTLFMLCGAYTLAQNAHVRGDFLYSSMRPRTQATLDLLLYLVFFVPGIAALIYAGYDYAAQSESARHRAAGSSRRRGRQSPTPPWPARAFLSP